MSMLLGLLLEKTLWVNLLALLATWLFKKWGFALTTADQLGLLAVVNMVLRFFTGRPIDWDPTMMSSKISTPKPFWLSRTVWWNAAWFVAVCVQLKTQVLFPALQSILIVLGNLLLRIKTDQRLSFRRQLGLIVALTGACLSLSCQTTKGGGITVDPVAAQMVIRDVAAFGVYTTVDNIPTSRPAFENTVEGLTFLLDSHNYSPEQVREVLDKNNVGAYMAILAAVDAYNLFAASVVSNGLDTANLRLPLTGLRDGIEFGLSINYPSMRVGVSRLLIDSTVRGPVPGARILPAGVDVAVTYFRSAKDGQWYWHAMSVNGRYVGSGSEGYHNQNDAVNGYRLFARAIVAGRVSESVRVQQ